MRNFLRGGGHELSAYLKGGLLKCVQYACKGGGGVKKGRKTACILYQWPLELFVCQYNKLLRKGILDINIEILDDKLNKALSCSSTAVASFLPHLLYAFIGSGPVNL